MRSYGTAESPTSWRRQQLWRQCMNFTTATLANYWLMDNHYDDAPWFDETTEDNGRIISSPHYTQRLMSHLCDLTCIDVDSCALCTYVRLRFQLGDDTYTPVYHQIYDMCWINRPFTYAQVEFSLTCCFIYSSMVSICMEYALISMLR